MVNGSDWPDATEITEHKAWILYDAKTLRSVNKLIRKKYIRLERDHYAIACQQHVPADETGDIFELDDDKDLKNGYVVVNTTSPAILRFAPNEYPVWTLPSSITRIPCASPLRFTGI